MPDNNNSAIAPQGTEPDRIDLVSDTSLKEWTKKLAVTEDQLKDAVAKVGDRATDALAAAGD